MTDLLVGASEHLWIGDDRILGEQLAEEVGQLRRACASYVKALAAEGAEIERLRDANRKQANMIVEGTVEIERLREVLEFVLEAARWHYDGDADPKNESPEDMTAHINGLIIQRIREVFGND